MTDLSIAGKVATVRVTWCAGALQNCRYQAWQVLSYKSTRRWVNWNTWVWAKRNMTLSLSLPPSLSLSPPFSLSLSPSLSLPVCVVQFKRSWRCPAVWPVVLRRWGRREETSGSLYSTLGPGTLPVPSSMAWVTQNVLIFWNIHSVVCACHRHTHTLTLYDCRLASPWGACIKVSMALHKG